MEAVIDQAPPIKTLSPFEQAKSYNYHIVKTAGVRSGKARISGRRITVSDVFFWIIKDKRTINDVCQDFDLTPAQIHAALTYYYDNQKEIDDQIAQADKEFEEGYNAQPQSIKDLFKNL